MIFEDTGLDVIIESEPERRFRANLRGLQHVKIEKKRRTLRSNGL